MLTPYRVSAVAFGFLYCSATLIMAAEPIGKAVEIRTAVTGAGGDFSINDPVHRDERIRTSKSGLGQFVFRDGTKLAVGWGSSVVVDKFVFDDTNSVKKLTIKAAKGTFRWVSGKSKHTAYEILTPAGTIGVRGTAFDFYVGADGTTAVVMLGGAASFCGAGGCKQLTRRCDCIIAKRNGNMTDVRRVNRTVFKTLGNARALPFLSGNQKLSGSSGYGGCGLASAVDVQRDDRAPRNEREVRPTPNSPGKIDTPEEQKPNDDKPDKRSDNKPDKPHRDRPGNDKQHHEHHEHHEHHDDGDDKPGGHGQHDGGDSNNDKHDGDNNDRGKHGGRDHNDGRSHHGHKGDRDKANHD
ncbi:FecR domain-containing protein [Pararhizobium sp. PWRC1-1]|uniref:FecR family protein n=1 Tax=Pararhizobium sp. PWRC1-1 TaxID=2804566 RepID=UPI003CF53950